MKARSTLASLTYTLANDISYDDEHFIINRVPSHSLDRRCLRWIDTCFILPAVIRLFENLLNEKPGSKKELEGVIYPTTNVQYKKGI